MIRGRIDDRGKRFASRRMRAAVYRKCRGRCRFCGDHLNDRYEIDHIVPWSLGGDTILQNLQLLCVSCNRRKGVNVMMAESKAVTKVEYSEDELYGGLRPGQKKAIADLQALSRPELPKGKVNFLIPDSPSVSALVSMSVGAGKTKVGARAAALLFSKGIINRIALVCPKTTMKSWSEEFLAEGKRLGVKNLEVDYEKGQAGPIRDILESNAVVGFMITYQTATLSAIEFQSLVSSDASDYYDNVKTLVILDEVHHLAFDDDHRWGVALSAICSRAYLVLGLSGTPWRTDTKQKIPLFRYSEPDEQGMFTILPDTEWTYANTVYANECRQADAIFVNMFQEGQVCVSAVCETSGDTIEKEVKPFRFDLSSQSKSNSGKAISKYINHRYAQAIDIGIERLINLRISDKPGLIRETRGAKMAIVAPSIASAEDYGRYVEARLGQGSTMVVGSHTPRVPALIEEFTRSETCLVIISCDVLSEGVTIKDLRVMVYLSNCRTWLKIMQRLGRLLRLRSHDITFGFTNCWIIFPDMKLFRDFFSKLRLRSNPYAPSLNIDKVKSIQCNADGTPKTPPGSPEFEDLSEEPKANDVNPNDLEGKPLCDNPDPFGWNASPSSTEKPSGDLFSTPYVRIDRDATSEEAALDRIKPHEETLYNQVPRFVEMAVEYARANASHRVYTERNLQNRANAVEFYREAGSPPVELPEPDLEELDFHISYSSRCKQQGALITATSQRVASTVMNAIFEKMAKTVTRAGRELCFTHVDWRGTRLAGLKSRSLKKLSRAELDAGKRHPSLEELENCYRVFEDMEQRVSDGDFSMMDMPDLIQKLSRRGGFNA